MNLLRSRTIIAHYFLKAMAAAMSDFTVLALMLCHKSVQQSSHPWQKMLQTAWGGSNMLEVRPPVSLEQTPQRFFNEEQRMRCLHFTREAVIELCHLQPQL